MNLDEFLKLIAALKGASLLDVAGMLFVIVLWRLGLWVAASVKRLSSQAWKAGLSTEDAEVRVTYTPKRKTSAPPSSNAQALPGSKPALRSTKSRRALSSKATTSRPQK